MILNGISESLRIVGIAVEGICMFAWELLRTDLIHLSPRQVGNHDLERR